MLTGNQDPPPCYYCLLPLCTVQHPVLMMHSLLPCFSSKLVETYAGLLAGTKVQRILNETSSKTCSLLVEKGYVWQKINKLNKIRKSLFFYYNFHILISKHKPNEHNVHG